MIQPHLKEAISRVMETMFFLPVQFAEGPRTLGQWLPCDATVLEAFIDFRAHRSGRGFLLVPAPCVREMAANFLGLPQAEVSEEQAQDTLKEAVNMMMGQMLSLLDRGGGYALGIPRFGGPADLSKFQEGQSPVAVLAFETGNTHLAAGVIES